MYNLKCRVCFGGETLDETNKTFKKVSNAKAYIKKFIGNCLYGEVKVINHIASNSNKTHLFIMSNGVTHFFDITKIK